MLAKEQLKRECVSIAYSGPILQRNLALRIFKLLNGTKLLLEEKIRDLQCGRKLYFLIRLLFWLEKSLDNKTYHELEKDDITKITLTGGITIT